MVKLWPFGPRLSEAQRSELSTTADELNSVLDACTSAWEEMHEQISPYHSRASEHCRKGVLWEPDTGSLDGMGNILGQYAEAYEENRETFASVELHDWAPAKFRKRHKHLGEIYFDAHGSWLELVRKAVREGLIDELGNQRMNVFWSGLNMMAQLKVCLDSRFKP